MKYVRGMATDAVFPVAHAVGSYRRFNLMKNKGKNIRQRSVFLYKMCGSPFSIFFFILMKEQKKNVHIIQKRMS